MTTLVCFHAHPDDEAIATAGVMAMASDAGHEVVLVTATRGEVGVPQPGVLDDDEQLGDRRVKELHAAADVLGVARVDILGYRDSGMIGEPTNDHPDCFWQADVEVAAAGLAEILRDVGADVLTVYDEHGGYGHPDHIQVHRVGYRAAELAAVPVVYEVTINRDNALAMMAELPPDQERPTIEDNPLFGTPAAQITHAVDVSSVVDRKRRAMAAHRSQISEESFFLSMPEDRFAMAFGTEWFIRQDMPRAPADPFHDRIID